MRDNSKLVRGLKEWNIELSDQQLCQFEQYYDLLMEWNAVMNLTAITDYEEVLVKHFLDSLSFIKALSSEKQLSFKEQLPVGEQSPPGNQLPSEKAIRIRNGKKLLDLGTGAGFPGIPLKIAFPDMEILLVDSLNKRIQFLNEVIKKLSLTGIEALHARAEELGRKEEYREQYDYCVSRAVARLASLSEYCIPFVKKEGYFISYKSGKVTEERKEAAYAIGMLGAKLVNTVTFNLPESDMERSLILIKKVKNTPKEYPRGGGKPSKKPLVKN